MLIAWVLIGGAVGLAAAQRGGYSSVKGVVVGALLGPLSILMFAIGGEKRTFRLCPMCRELVKMDAKRCKHCHAELPAPTEIERAPVAAPRNFSLARLAVFIAVSIIFLVAMLYFGNPNR